MKKRIVLWFFAPLLLINILGCAPLIIGATAAGLVTGYAVSKDTVQGDTDKPYNNLWNSALIVGRIRGSIQVQDYNKGYIELKTESRYIWIRLVRLTRATTRLKVSARQYHLPNIALAKDIFAKIIEETK